MAAKCVASLLILAASVPTSRGVEAQTVSTHPGNWIVLAGSPVQPVADTIFAGMGNEIVILTACIDPVPAGASFPTYSAWVGVRVNGSLVARGVLKNQPIYPTCTTFRFNPGTNNIDISSDPITPVPAGSQFGKGAHGSYTISVIAR